MANTTTHVIRGKLHWAKVLGDPRMNTFTEEREWSVDVSPDKAGIDEIVRIGAKDKLRDPKPGDTRKGKFISFRQKEFRTDKDGKKTPTKKIKIVDVTGKVWPENKLIGNETVADVKFNYVDFGKGKPKGAYIQAIRVLEHVSFEVQEFAPLSEDDEFFAEAEDRVESLEDEFEGSSVDAAEAAGDGETNIDDLDDDIDEVF